MKSNVSWYKLAAMSTSNAYQTLGVEPGISKENLLKTLRDLRKQLHPDVSKHPDATQQFQEAEQAAKIILEDISGVEQGGAQDYYSTAHTYAATIFSDPKLNEAWNQILSNYGDFVYKADVSPNEVNTKIKTPYSMIGTMAYYDWNALFEDYDFAGLFDYTDDTTMSEVLLSQNGQITGSVYMSGIVDELKNEPLIDALNSFSSIVGNKYDNGTLDVSDKEAVLTVLGMGDWDVLEIENRLFDVFYPNSNIPKDVYFLQVSSVIPPIPKTWDDYDGYMQFYTIPNNMSLDEFKPIYEHARTLNYEEAYDYLAQHGIYIIKSGQNIYDVSAEDAYDWIQGWEEHLKQKDFNYDDVKEWYKKMTMLIQKEKTNTTRIQKEQLQANERETNMKYAQTDDEFWRSIQIESSLAPTWKQCAYCGGFVTPNDEVVFPPGFDRSQIPEDEPYPANVVVKFAPEYVNRISHVLCPKCEPRIKAELHEEMRRMDERGAKINMLFSKKAQTKKEETKQMLKFVNDRMGVVKFKKIPSTGPHEYGLGAKAWLREYTTFNEQKMERMPTKQIFAIAMNYWGKLLSIKEYYYEEQAGTPTQLSLFAGGKKHMIKTSMNKDIKDFSSQLKEIGMPKIAQNLADDNQKMLQARDTLTKENVKTVMEDVAIAESKLKTLQRLVSSSGYDQQKLEEIQTEMGQLIVKSQQIHGRLTNMYNQAFGENFQ